jgi:type II secretory pathway predicted ATPase ExeA
LYPSEEHSRVFEEIFAAVYRRDGLICLTGDPGTGKTVICRRLLEELGDEYHVVVVNTPPKTPEDMTHTLDEALGEMEGDSKIPVAIFDEAQHLDFRCLDHIKFLTNLEKEGGKLIQIILVGQPELEEKLGHKRFVQLEQRIGAKLRLGSLGAKEILPYLTHHLEVAKIARDLQFTRGAARTLFRKTGGVPRLINRIASIAVDLAVEEGKAKIRPSLIRRAELKVSAARGDWQETAQPGFELGRLAALVALLIVSVGALFYTHPEWPSPVDWLYNGKAQATFQPSRFALKAGTFLKREEAENLRAQLSDWGLPSLVVSKDLGDGWVLYQVRLQETYSPEEAESKLDLLRNQGVAGADKISVAGQ